MLDGEVAPPGAAAFQVAPETGGHPWKTTARGLVGFRVPGRVGHRAGPRVDDQCARVPDGDAAGRETAGASGCAGGSDGETSPRRRCPTGTPPWALGPTLRVWGTRRLGGVSGGDSRGSRKAWGHPDNGRSILSRTQCSGSGWALGCHPETNAIPTRNERAYGRPLRFGQGMGWLAQKPSFCVGPGLLTTVKLSPT